jgi:hypothetical protein
MADKSKTGPKRIFSPDIAERILERIADGESLRTICREEEYPSRYTVIRWLWGDDENAKAFEFATKYARAREAQGDVMDDRILETADTVTSETAAADRVKIMAYQWRAAKLRPKVYGDKQHVEHSGRVGLHEASLDELK